MLKIIIKKNFFKLVENQNRSNKSINNKTNKLNKNLKKENLKNWIIIKLTIKKTINKKNF